jgi:hypothetical protein
MASAAHIAANRLNAQESTGLSDAQARQRCGGALSWHPPAELRSTAPQPSRVWSRKNRELGKQSRFIE